MKVPKSLAAHLVALESGAYASAAQWLPAKNDPQTFQDEHIWLTSILADARTEAVVAVLKDEFRRSPIRWVAFFHAMWRASGGLHPRAGFDWHRAQLAEAATLSAQISGVARDLASLVRQLAATGVALPAELKDLRGLLTTTRLRQGEHIDYLLGRGEADDGEWIGHEVARVNNALSWQFAPKIDAAIDALSVAASVYVPHFDDAVGASISRQAHEKNELIRAAAIQLSRNLVPLSDVVASATAEMINIISDDPDDLVNGRAVCAQFERVKKTQSDF